MEPNTGPKGVHGTDLVELQNRLDQILEQYLQQLDMYTSAQATIQKDLAAGFFSLAKANRDASGGRRYGQDWYDGRMKATRRVHVQQNDKDPDHDSNVASKSNLTISFVAPDSKSGTENGKSATPVQTPAHQPSPTATPEPESGEHTKSSSEEPSEDALKATISDPLRWFGILVPSELRRAQSSFLATFEEPTISGTGTAIVSQDEKTKEPDLTRSPILDAVIASSRMRELEMDARQVRKLVKKLAKSATSSTVVT
jgi:hypothetical protein